MIIIIGIICIIGIIGIIIGIIWLKHLRACRGQEQSRKLLARHGASTMARASSTA